MQYLPLDIFYMRDEENIFTYKRVGEIGLKLVISFEWFLTTLRSHSCLDQLHGDVVHCSNTHMMRRMASQSTDWFLLETNSFYSLMLHASYGYVNDQ